MNTQETAALLTMCSGYDNREASELQLRAWAEALADVELSEAQAAVKKHYTQDLNPHRITVTDVLLVVKAARRPSSHARLDAAKAAMGAVRDCELCDDLGYRLPARAVVCTHVERPAVNARQRVARAIEARRAESS